MYGACKLDVNADAAASYRDPLPTDEEQCQVCGRVEQVRNMLECDVCDWMVCTTCRVRFVYEDWQLVRQPCLVCFQCETESEVDEIAYVFDHAWFDAEIGAKEIWVEPIQGRQPPVAN